jgi:hypothetical protein
VKRIPVLFILSLYDIKGTVKMAVLSYGGPWAWILV